MFVERVSERNLLVHWHLMGWLTYLIQTRYRKEPMCLHWLMPWLHVK